MKKSCLTLAVALACQSLSALAASPDAGRDRLVACGAETDQARRLACFDREIAPFRTPAPPSPVAPAQGAASPPAPPAPAVQRPAAPPAPIVQAPAPRAAELGEEQLKGKARPPSTENVDLRAHITALRQVEGGTSSVTLDNGQIWKHEDSVLGSYLRVGDAVTIRKGTLGSYRLTRDEGDDKNWIRATRVR